MTYCLGVKVEEGLMALADTRITSGTETTTAKKISIHNNGNDHLFLMTSGLRSVRDKAVTYFEEVLESEQYEFNKMYKVVNEFGNQLRRVAAEDKAALAESGLFFNLFSIVGGRLKDDKEHKLYLLYPEGNWIEIGDATPFTIIGNSGYGKPVLNRALTYKSPLKFALKTGFLSFDSTRVSANDVGYPIDIVIYRKDTGEMIERRYTEDDLGHIAEAWGESLKELIRQIPDDLGEDVFDLKKGKGQPKDGLTQIQVQQQ